MPIGDDHTIRELLKHSKSIAVLGASPKPGRDSGAIADYMARKGFKIYPVNPAYSEVFGMKCYPDLTAIGSAVDIVNIFRRSDEVVPLVEDAIKIGAKAVWMQLGVVNVEAAQRAEEAGLVVVMDKCISVEFRRLVQ